MNFTIWDVKQFAVQFIDQQYETFLFWFPLVLCKCYIVDYIFQLNYHTFVSVPVNNNMEKLIDMMRNEKFKISHVQYRSPLKPFDGST